MTRITLTRPDDWHIHLRDGEALARTVTDVSRVFGRAIVMPNLKPPVITTSQAASYRDRILGHIPSGSTFTPLMTLYLTDNTSPEEIQKAKASGFVHGVKLYPAGATTHSDDGLTHIEKAYRCLEVMQECNMPLLIHGEVTDKHIDIFDREAVFIDTILEPLTRRFPSLKIVLEHITTHQAVQFVQSTSGSVAATITAHHLLYNRNHMLAGGIRPHFYCLPILKRNTHQEALLSAATSGSPRFFLGTDSAPHAQHTKENACGCAGCYTAHAAIELYAEAFAAHNALDKLEGFASFYGADFYELPRNTDTITLEQQPWTVPNTLNMASHPLIPLRAGEIIHWQVINACS